MILDQLGDLQTLAKRASEAVSELNEDAAFAVVEDQVTKARSLFVNLGVARVRPLSLLTDAERQPVLQAAASAKQALKTISDASDDELAAYASASAEKRGSLLAISRQAQSLRADLLAAQQSLLTRLADEIWPNDQLSRLDVMAHLSATPGIAEVAKRIERTHERLRERATASDVGLEASELDSLIEEAANAAEEARQLGSEPVPEDVLDFWESASSEDGAALEKLTPSVRAWLDDHDALRSFRINRIR